MEHFVKIFPKPRLIEQLMRDLHYSAALMGIDIDPRAMRLFSLYSRELLLWNRHMNLVSDESAHDIVERHLIDSLTPLRFLGKSGGVMVDLGSGGGFPGIPLKIMLPNIHLYLVDSTRKKTSFLSHVVGILQLSRIEVIRARVEELLENTEFAGKFDTVISRAAFSLKCLLDFSAVFLKRGGLLIAMKGNALREEACAIKETAKKNGMEFIASEIKDFSESYSLKKIIIYRRT